MRMHQHELYWPKSRTADRSSVRCHTPDICRARAACPVPQIHTDYCGAHVEVDESTRCPRFALCVGSTVLPQSLRS
jgi:hypothetical protein